MHTDNNAKVYFGIEAGGTKINCVVGDENANILAHKRVDTTTPEISLSAVNDFFQTQKQHYKNVKALGIASFGPIDLHENSPTYGSITDTPKPHWSHVNIVEYFQKALNLPIAFDTDVNGAAIGEHRYGAAQGLDDFIYVTVGTGIGAGVFAHGKPIKGLHHTEIGHMLVPRIPSRNIVNSSCPFHDNCLSAFASGPAIAAHWGKPAKQLPENHPAWDLEAQYLAMMCMNLSLCYSPRKIILGGGVMSQRHLFPAIHNHLKALFNGYMVPEIPLDHYIVPPKLHGKSGEVGALVMSIEAAE